MAITQAQEMVAFWLQAERDCGAFKTVQHGDRLLTNQNIAEIVKIREGWERRVMNEARAGQLFSRASFE